MTEYQPSVPPRVRSFVYFLQLGTAVLSLLVSGLVAVFLGPEAAIKAAAACSVVQGAVGVLGGGLGVVYRPTGPAGDQLP